jgi:hypothetical protein
MAGIIGLVNDELGYILLSKISNIHGIHSSLGKIMKRKIQLARTSHPR